MSQFLDNYKTQLRVLEILIQILILCAIIYLISEKYFLHYKVVLVTEEIKGVYIPVKEIIVNGKITDPIYSIDTTLLNHTGEKLILTNMQNNQFIYNIT